ncbi:MAG: hypothetical protein FWE93_04160 [Alphaproteobacteria bacterium]|nr:hypothetical protein [Alphaproteobacteria bacterium]
MSENKNICKIYVHPKHYGSNEGSVVYRIDTYSSKFGEHDLTRYNSESAGPCHGQYDEHKGKTLIHGRRIEKEGNYVVELLYCTNGTPVRKSIPHDILAAVIAKNEMNKNANNFRRNNGFAPIEIEDIITFDPEIVEPTRTWTVDNIGVNPFIKSEM